MNHHRDLVFCTYIPHRIETRIVDRNALAVDVLLPHAEVLPDLEADRAVLDVLFELSGYSLSVIRLADPLVIDIGHARKAGALRMSLDCVEELFRSFTEASRDRRTQHDAHVEGVHVLQHGVEFRGVPLMGMDVDKRDIWLWAPSVLGTTSMAFGSYSSMVGAGGGCWADANTAKNRTGAASFLMLNVSINRLSRYVCDAPYGAVSAGVSAGFTSGNATILLT